MCVFEEGFGGTETDELRKINKYICGLGARFECSLTRSHPNLAPSTGITGKSEKGGRKTSDTTAGGRLHAVYRTKL